MSYLSILMSDEDEFINLEDIIPTVTFKDENFDKDAELDDTGESCYQIQSNDNTNTSIILEVGKFTEIPSILINKFDMSPKIRCIISSCFYDTNSLVSVESLCKFSMLKLLVNYNNGQTLNPLGCLLLNFNTFDHKVKKKSIVHYLSNKSSKIDLEGFWTVSFHFEEKMIMFEKYKEYLGNNMMIEQLMKYLFDDRVQSIIDRLVNLC
jgi:hypothetical protein